MFTIEMLPAGPGDCLWIEYGTAQNPRRILIDGGASPSASSELRRRTRALGQAAHFELLVITHVDDDHIDGILGLLSDTQSQATFGEVWFNDRIDHAGGAAPVSVGQGNRLSRLLLNQNQPWNVAFGGRGVAIEPTGRLPVLNLAGNMRVTLLSPGVGELKALRDVWPEAVAGTALAGPDSPPLPPGIAAVRTCPPVNLLGNLAAIAARPFSEERTETNASSIGVLLEYHGRRLLLGADARADVLARNLRRLSRQRAETPFRVDAYKVAHHGSENNTSNDLLSTIACPAYLFSTNGRQGFCHPHEPAIARMVLNQPNARLEFNSESDASRPWRDPMLRAEGRGYVPVYPTDRASQAIAIRRT
ncbi:MAG TPA: hypothetical protein VFP66_01650 [Candidatus Limnocylindrales bacterium]|nr:hypothetical protein [Candidatus Limnocylindrales bacterium]